MWYESNNMSRYFQQTCPNTAIDSWETSDGRATATSLHPKCCQRIAAKKWFSMPQYVEPCFSPATDIRKASTALLWGSNVPLVEAFLRTMTGGTRTVLRKIVEHTQSSNNNNNHVQCPNSQVHQTKGVSIGQDALSSNSPPKFAYQRRPTGQGHL